MKSKRIQRCVSRVVDLDIGLPTAANINECHCLAKASATKAVEYAVRCGQLLTAKKNELDRGDFDGWVEKNCDFSRSMAYNYLKALNRATALDDSKPAAAAAAAFPSIRGLLGIESKPQKKQPDTSARSVKGAVMNPPESAAQGSEAGNRNTPVGVDTGPVRPPVPGPDPVLADDWTPEVPGAEEMEAIEREIEESEAKVLRTDDVTAGYHNELKRQAAEIAVLKTTRDGYMNGKAAVTKMLQAEQRKTEKQSKRIAELEKENAKLLEQIEALRERVSIMEAA